MRIKYSKITNYFFSPRFHFNRFQFNLVAIFFIGFGIALGGYLTVKNVLFPLIFASSSTWTQTDWSDPSTYTSSSNIGTSTTGQAALSTTD